MDGLRYYVMSLFIFSAFSAHGAQEYKEECKEKIKKLRKLKIHMVLPKGSKLHASSRTFHLLLPSDVITIAEIKEVFKKEIDYLAHQKPTCHCGGPCADIRAATALVKHADEPLQITYMGSEIHDDARLETLSDFNLADSVLYAKFD